LAGAGFRVLGVERSEALVQRARTETHVFMMRCWTADELSAYLAKAGFTGLQLRLGATAGIAPDRLLVTARK
jgi:hypothetical protein